MPIYDYECRACGPFTAIRPMAEYAAPQTCQVCGEPSPRAFLTAPALATMDATKRKGIAVNERSAHEPRRASGGHGPGCGCCTPRRKLAPTGAAKTFPGARPWMISH